MRKNLILVLIFIFLMGLCHKPSFNNYKKLQISPGLPLKDCPTLMEECLK